MSDKKIVLWMGRPIEELSREELIDAVNLMAGQVEAERQMHMHTLDILGPQPASARAGK